jgi:uncharacterized protein YjbJ (UPF0337 family)
MAILLLYAAVMARTCIMRDAQGGFPMGHMDHDRPDDSNAPRHKPGSVREETSAFGQRVKGEAENIAGEVTGNDSLEDKGERENAAGRDRQNRNDAV